MTNDEAKAYVEKYLKENQVKPKDIYSVAWEILRIHDEYVQEQEYNEYKINNPKSNVGGIIIEEPFYAIDIKYREKDYLIENYAQIFNELSTQLKK